jgi:hypothetical protein
VLALGLMKPQLVIVFPIVFLAQRRWKALGAWLGVAVVLTAASVAVLGAGGVVSYIRLLTSDVYEHGIAIPMSYRMLSVLALIRSVTPPAVWGVAPLIAVAVLTPLTIGFLRLARRRARSATDLTLLYSLTIVFTVLISPHFFVYDGVLLFLPALVLAGRGAKRPETRSVLVLTYVLAWGVSWAHLDPAAASWPLSAVAAPWVVVGIFLVYRLLRAELVESAAPSGSEEPQRSVSVTRSPASLPVCATVPAGSSSTE